MSRRNHNESSHTLTIPHKLWQAPCEKYGDTWAVSLRDVIAQDVYGRGPKRDFSDTPEVHTVSEQARLYEPDYTTQPRPDVEPIVWTADMIHRRGSEIGSIIWSEKIGRHCMRSRKLIPVGVRIVLYTPRDGRTRSVLLEYYDQPPHLAPPRDLTNLGIV